jgi:hypothetical protein
MRPRIFLRVSESASLQASGLETAYLRTPWKKLNLKDKLLDIEAVGNDLQLLAEAFAPLLKIRKMVISGN